MRPIRLTMEAFGSYGERTVIDFTKPRQNLFLVTGNTGSGKSTIFDAIAFALYGEASSGENKKSGMELQSQYVAFGKTKPFVELVFTENNIRYTVKRIPRHFDAKGVEHGSEVELKKENAAICSGVQNANKLLIDILGLTKGQFTQVSMLAQGEFMKLLRDPTSEKKAVFRNLFRTGVYEELVTELFDRKKKHLDELGAIFSETRSAAEGIKLPEDHERADKIREILTKFRTDKELDVTALESLIEELEAVCDSLKNSVSEAEKLSDAKKAQNDTEQNKLSTAKALISSFETLENAERELEDYASREEEMRAKKSLAEKLTAAYEIDGYFKLYDLSREKLTKAVQDLEKLKADLPGLREKTQTAARNEAQAKDERDEQNEAFVKVKERVEQSLDIFKKINAKQKEVADLSGKSERAKANAKNAADKLSELEEQEKLWKARSEELSNASVELADCKHKMEGLDKLFSELAGLRGLFGECQDCEREAKEALEKFQDAQREYLDKEREYEEMQNAYLGAQAGILAKEKLRPGCKCPVCGSLEHPEPCVLPEGYQSFSRESIEELKRKLDEYREIKEKAFAQSESSAKVKAEKHDQYDKAFNEFNDSLKSRFDDAPDKLTLDKAREILENRENRLQSDLKDKEKAVADLNELQQKLKTAENDKQSLKEKKEAADSEAAKLDKDLAAAVSECKTLERQKSFSTEEDALSARSGAKQSYDDAYAVWDNANSELEKAKSEEDKTSALIKKYQSDIPDMKTELGKRENDYRAAMTRLGLTEDEWKALTGEHGKDEINELRNSYNKFDNDRANANGAAEAARKAIGNRPRPDIEELERRAADAEAASKEAVNRLIVLNGILNTDRDILKRVTSKANERANIIKSCELTEGLYRRLSGNVSKGRVDIETFVQRYYLEQILSAANARFQEMSDGQYELCLMDLEDAAHSKNRGLDLMVYSSVTGKKREVRTLSGGESFMAALALSLGMADVIQAKSAAVRSEIMFIDEGFGALDDSSRRHAVRVLQKMAAGSHLIGIISHVSELKSAIDDQLVITKDERGSHAAWRLN